ncbi:Shikimate dehydrogenase (NADP(+)) [Vibrio stylophorae]|uniref:Shikimate dehydrogenase (NADP(+)) n=2 Tax=Vibrio stylophorae TaxID=659351 RepID=A0ABN8DPD2_9VIBR|nr:Shikimate dehydrogenase (NADP(+)) [Vibrio stylophorae]
MDQYAVFGHPISHSKSPYIHTLFAQQTQQQMAYQAMDPHPQSFEQAAREFFAAGGKGCNVTLPYKEAAFAFADRLTERAQLAGAVNTLKKLDDGGILGDNTDGAGLVADLLAQGAPLNGGRILLLGAGGAARGALLPLLAEKPAQLVIANRTHEKAQQLAQQFSPWGPIEALSFAQVMGPFDCIINSTSASIQGEVPPIASSTVAEHTLCYDMMYGKETAFIAWAKLHGAQRCFDGLGMLVGQAAESFMLWRGLRPGSKQVLRELRKALVV